ncbi:DUF4124 domain-containing protein [Halomonas denitrificans]|nr:DUF4124 domain-containing protein [Halomonas denitrificans]
MNILKIAGLALVLAASTSGWGQTFYKWTDDEGTTHFTASPPDDRDYETVNTSISVVSRVGGSTAPEPAPEDEEEAADEAQMPRQGEPDPEQVAARCTQARENMFWLQNRRRIEVERADGTIEYVEGEDREAMIAETQAFIDQWCDEQAG